MEKLMSSSSVHLAQRWRCEMTVHPQPTLLPSPHRLRTIFWTLSDDNHSLWIKVHLSPYSSSYLLLYIILLIGLHQILCSPSVCPLICVQINPQSLQCGDVKIHSWWMDACVCVRAYDLLYEKDRNTTNHQRPFQNSA